MIRSTGTVFRYLFVSVIALFCLATVSGQTIRTRRVMTGLNQPISIVSSPTTDRFLYVVERGGRIRVWDRTTENVLQTPFLDIRDRVTAGQDGGLVSAAFDPDFENNGYVYVQYTDNSSTRPNNQLSRFTVGLSGNADPNSEFPILYAEQPHTAHNGNWIGFGPDDLLYYTLGDGGNQHDPGNNGQDTSTLLGSVLRIDVRNGRDDFPNDPEANYGIPADNPFVGADGRDEIFAYGLRNPWRASFDRQTGDFYIGDTGQDTFEEVNFISADSTGGENFGWRLREGFDATSTGGVGGPATEDMVDPVYAYRHGSGPFQGNSIIGGHVYRGPITNETVQGHYFFTDWARNTVWSIQVDSETGLMIEGSQRDWTDQLAPAQGELTSIAGQGEDNDGNLYFARLGGGEVYMLYLETGNGDFNDDGVYDCADIDSLIAEIASGGSTSEFDLNSDGSVNLDDRDAWLAEAGVGNLGPGKSFLLGDATLDGVVDVSDFAVWNTNKFSNTGAWCQGDFNADGLTDVSDFGIWNSNKFTASEPAAVPEPDGVAAMLVGLTLLMLTRRRRRCERTYEAMPAHSSDVS